MQLPDQIQKQVDEMEALEALMAADPDVPDVPDTTDGEPESVAAPAQKPEPEPKPETDWEQKYRSLEGKFNSNVRHLESTKDQLKSLTDEVEKLKQKPAAPEAKSREVEDDEELVGADIVKAAERAAARAIAKVQMKLDALESENANLKSQLTQVSEGQTVLANDGFLEKLTEVMPNWRQLEVTDQGQSFLNSKIPGTGQTWNQALHGAAGNFDVEETAEIYKELVRRHPELGAPKGKNVNDELARQVTPTKSKAPSQEPTKKIWTATEYSAGWDDISKRRVQGAEAEQLSNELESAMAEGRVR